MYQQQSERTTQNLPFCLHFVPIFFLCFFAASSASVRLQLFNQTGRINKNNEKPKRVEGEMHRWPDKRSISAQRSTIHGCAQSGDLKGLQKLLRDNPCLINERCPVMEETPLHISAAYNRRDIVKFLLYWQGSEEVELEAKDVRGETPLHIAAMNGCTDIARLLINHGAFVDAKAITGMTPMHLAIRYSLRFGDCSIVETLLELEADCNAEDNAGKTPLDRLPQGPASEKLRQLLLRRLKEQRKEKAIQGKEKAIQACRKSKTIMYELKKELSTIVGLEELKSELMNWAKGMVLDEMRRAFGLEIGARRPPHMVFLGSPGTGKTTMARILGKLLKKVGVLLTDNVTEVQRTDLVGEYIGQTGLKTRQKIREAENGILFVDEAYRLMPKDSDRDFGVQALEEIMSVMDSGNLTVIFAGYSEPMKRVINANEGFRRRVTKFFHFDDFTQKELAEVLFTKMNNQGEDSELYGFKLHDTCNEDSVAELIQKETTEKQRREMNGGLATILLTNSRENLDRRLALDCIDTDELITITLEDLRASLQSLVR